MSVTWYGWNVARNHLPVFLAVLFLIACSTDRRFERDPAAMEAADILSFYRAQSRVTSPGKYAYLYEGVPSDVEGSVSAVQSVLVHLVQIELEKTVLPSRRIQHDINVNTVERMLEVISNRDDRPLVAARSTENRFVGICSHHAILTCSLLRHHDIPCRVRGGFETHVSETHHDHWICEYWDRKTDRWIRIDPEINAFLGDKWGVTYDRLNIPDSVFMSGAEAWVACRSGSEDPSRFGVRGDEWIGGWDFVLNSLVLDFLALNRVELLPWDDVRLTAKGYDRLSPADLAFLDRIADLALDITANFTSIRKLSEEQADRLLE